ncbi:hypothetical protein [Dokdonia donghaensis]|uniref:hypothetical protein n=1 Tax=Dokdonia donghaensis TaxID=326320 RepID=UPI0035C81F4D
MSRRNVIYILTLSRKRTTPPHRKIRHLHRHFYSIFKTKKRFRNKSEPLNYEVLLRFRESVKPLTPAAC